METASEIIKKLSPLKVALCKIPPDKDGFFGRSKINENVNKYNEALENVATELSGAFDNDVVFSNNILETKDISIDGIHPSVSHGIPKLVRNNWNFYVHLGLTVSETEIKELSTETLEKILISMITTVFWFPSKTSIFTSNSLKIWLMFC